MKEGRGSNGETGREREVKREGERRCDCGRGGDSLVDGQKDKRRRGEGNMSVGWVAMKKLSDA